MAADSDRAPDGLERRRIPVPDAWSFPAESVAELSRRLAAGGDGATLSVFPYREGGLMRLRLRVVPADGSDAAKLASEPDINDSRPCPPFTGCGGG